MVVVCMLQSCAVPCGESIKNNYIVSGYVLAVATFDRKRIANLSLPIRSCKVISSLNPLFNVFREEVAQGYPYGTHVLGL